MKLLITGSSHAIKLQLAVTRNVAADAIAKIGADEIDWFITGSNSTLEVDPQTSELSPPDGYDRVRADGGPKMHQSVTPTLLNDYDCILYSAVGLRFQINKLHPVWDAIDRPLSSACLRQIALHDSMMGQHARNFRLMRESGFSGEIHAERWARPQELSEGISYDVWERLCVEEEAAIDEICAEYGVLALPRPDGCEFLTTPDFGDSHLLSTHGNLDYAAVTLDYLAKQRA